MRVGQGCSWRSPPAIHGSQANLTMHTDWNHVLCGAVQATTMGSPAVTQEAVYHCTGNPMPQDIEQCATWLLNETIADAFQSAHGAIEKL